MTYVARLMRSLLRKVKVRTWVALGILLLILPVVFISLFRPTSPEAAWYDDTYAYRKKLTFSHGSSVTNNTVTFTIDTATLTTDKMQADCDDSRFTDINGAVLAYQVVSGCDTASTEYDVLFPSITANETVVAYFYYGNTSASTRSQDLSGYTNITPTVTAGSEQAGDGPIAYWSFNEGQGQDAFDSTSSDNDGVLGTDNTVTSDDPTWKSEDLCISGKCLYFDNTDDNVRVASATNFQDIDNLDGDVTIEAWIRKPTQDAGSWDTILATEFFRFSVTSSRTLQWSWTDGVNNSVGPGSSSSTPVVLNKWHHVAAVADNGTAVLYIDGKSVGGGTIADYSRTISNVRIGADGLSGIGGNDYFHGFIDEVKIYNYAKSSADIQASFNKSSAAYLGNSSLQGLSDGLVAYWKMDESSWSGAANEIIDSSGTSNNGTLTTGASITTGKFYNAGSFDGNGYFTTSATSVSTGANAQWTLSAWVKSSALDSTDDPIISYGSSSTGQGPHISRSQTNKWRVSTFGSGNDYDAANAVAGVWTHITGVSDGKSLRLYVNGEQAGSDFTPASNSPTNATAKVAALQNNTRRFTGQIDEARIYNRALSSEEVKALYSWAPGPVNHWKMDENTGTTTTYDSMTTGTNGTLNSMAESIWTQGKFGSAIDFDGTDDSISFGDTTVFDGADRDFSLAFWMYMNDNNATETILGKSSASMGSAGTVGFDVVWQDSVNGITWRINDGDAAAIAIGGSGFNIANNTWHHIGLTADRDGQGCLWIDGVRSDCEDISTVNGDLNNANVLVMGRRSNSTANEHYTGKLDDVRVYNYVRSGSQITEDMNAGHPLGGSPVGSQVAYWALDEQQGTSVNNSSSGTFTTSISGALWKTKSDCKINGCLDFDGTDDVLTVTNANAIDFDGNLVNGFTFSTWIYPDGAGEGTGGQIFQKGTNTWLRVDTLSSGKLDIEGSLDLTTTDATLNVSTAVTQSTWNHIAVTYTDDNDDEITIWVNGKAVGSSTNGVGTPAITDTANLLLGGTTTNNFDGKIDEFKVYSSELTLEQMRVDMNAGSGISFGVTGQSEASTLSDGAGNPPLAVWKFDQKSGTNAPDTSGNGYNVTLNANFDNDSTSGWTQGKIGNAVHYDGTNDLAQVANTAFSLVGAGAFTLETWVNIDTISTTVNHRIITYQQGSGGTDGYHLALVRSSAATCGSRFIFEVKKSNTYYAAGCASTSTTASTGTWYHVVGVFDGATNTPTLYVNGVKQDGTTLQSLGLGVADTLTFASQSTAGTNLLDGIIDHTTVYNYARTPTQIAYDFNRGGPVGYWQFDECQGTTAYDASGNGNNGTITPGASGNTSAGTCNSGTSTEMWNDGTDGKINASLGFDGTNDYVALPDNILDKYSIGSVCTWAYYDKSSDDGSLNALFAYSDVATADYKHSFYISENGTDSAMVKAVIRTNTGSNQVDYSTANDVIVRQTWNHYCFTQASNGTGVKLYINAKPVTFTATISGTGSLDHWFDDISTQAENASIGNIQDNVPDSFFTGKIDDMRIYNYALSADQVKKVMNDNAGTRFAPTTGQP